MACSSCGQVVSSSNSIICQPYFEIFRKAVYTYELPVLGLSSACYSVTASNGKRYDLIRVSEVCLRDKFRIRSEGFTGLKTASGVFVKEASKSDDSWFPGFCWQAIHCGGCRSPQLLGWAFSKDPPGRKLQPSGFFALIVTKLCERFMTFPLPSPGRNTGWLDGLSCRRDLVHLHPLPGHRGLGVDELLRSTAPGASAAARGFASMPLQLLPSTTSRHPVASRQEGERGLQILAARKCDGTESSDEEYEDFVRRREVARRSASTTQAVAHRAAHLETGPHSLQNQRSSCASSASKPISNRGNHRLKSQGLPPLSGRSS